MSDRERRVTVARRFQVALHFGLIFRVGQVQGKGARSEPRLAISGGAAKVLDGINVHGRCLALLCRHSRRDVTNVSPLLLA